MLDADAFHGGNLFTGRAFHALVWGASRSGQAIPNAAMRSKGRGVHLRASKMNPSAKERQVRTDCTPLMRCARGSKPGLLRTFFAPLASLLLWECTVMF